MARVVIAGGGIGGLAAALGLARAGQRPLVLERQPAFGELGAGIQLAPNAFKALGRLGVPPRPGPEAVLIDELRLMDAVSARTLAVLPLRDGFAARYGAPYAVVQRGHLHGTLLEACRAAGVELRPGAEVTGYRQDDAGVTVLLRSGEPVRAAALVGADGLRSAVRRRVTGDGEPVPSGHVTFRALVPAARMPAPLRRAAAVLWAGPGCHVVHYPLAGGERYNLVATRDLGATGTAGGRPVGREEVLAHFGGLCALPAALLEAGADWRAWVLCDRPPGRRWQDGRVVLLGDAAHPMLQYAAQGACMALEDAACLAQETDGGEPDFGKVFARYAEARQDRTARVQRVSRLMGERVYHPAGPAAAARTAMLAALDGPAMHAELDWLYGGPDEGRPRGAA